MSVNKRRPHVYVLPEDSANNQLATGFHLELGQIRQLQVLNHAGGWRSVLDKFQSDHIMGMKRYPDRVMVLLIDFDGHSDRLEEAKAVIPNELIDRVLVLGVWTEPERLKPDFGLSLEQIGRDLARECREGSDVTWGHNLLRHNAGEVDRLGERVRSILFQAN